MKLPHKLAKQPVIEAIFEMRFKSQAAVSSILPGFLFTKLSGEKSIERLPAAEFPQQMRHIHPALQFAPLVRVRWDAFFILIGDRNVGLACKIPYPGWQAFKATILQLVEWVTQVSIIESVERAALKYTNIIPSELGDARSLVKFELLVGEHSAAGDKFQIRVEVPKDDLLHVVQIISSGTAMLADGTSRTGVTLDIDTIAAIANIPFQKFAGTLADRIEAVHRENKVMFFDCLKPETIKKLEPSYDRNRESAFAPFYRRHSRRVHGSYTFQ
jgi:uncharacterized protein (TIGR04255 family)